MWNSSRQWYVISNRKYIVERSRVPTQCLVIVERLTFVFRERRREIVGKMEKFDKSSLGTATGPAADFRGTDGSLVSALKTLLFFTVLMVTLPIGLYFASKSFVFEASMGMSNKDSYFYAAIVAVVAVHVVLALFVYVAWNEGSRQWREGKQD
ncbi:vacuolar ATPase assembly integral membrane protein VMA21 [Arapaima gigas]